MRTPKVLFYDIETSPNLAYVWGLYEQNVIDVKKDWGMLSFAWKWGGTDKVECLSLRSFKGSKESRERQLCRALHGLLNEADITVAHNGDQFDYKKARAKFIKYGFPPVKIVPSVDTNKVAKRYFNFSSNSLDSIGRYLGLGRKVKTPGFDLWLGCLANKDDSWELMEKYNIQDIVLLEKVYNKFLPWMHSHPNMCILNDAAAGCPKCGSQKIIRRGFRVTNVRKQQLWLCKTCKGWFQTGLTK